eukprot:IDg1769t1
MSSKKNWLPTFDGLTNDSANFIRAILLSSVSVSFTVLVRRKSKPSFLSPSRVDLDIIEAEARLLSVPHLRMGISSTAVLVSLRSYLTARCFISCDQIHQPQSLQLQRSAGPVPNARKSL